MRRDGRRRQNFNIQTTLSKPKEKLGIAKGKALFQGYDCNIFLLSPSIDVPNCHSERPKEEKVEVLPILLPSIREMNLTIFRYKQNTTKVSICT
jgi:hypothetical protein